jgi:hypothetical protein
MHVYPNGRWSICPKRDKFANQILTAADSQTPGLSDNGPAGRSAAESFNNLPAPVLAERSDHLTPACRTKGDLTSSEAQESTTRPPSGASGEVSIANSGASTDSCGGQNFESVGGVEGHAQRNVSLHDGAASGGETHSWTLHSKAASASAGIESGPTDSTTLEASGTAGSRTAGEGIASPSPLNDHEKPALVVSSAGGQPSADNGPLASSIIHSLPHFANKLDDRSVDFLASGILARVRGLTLNGIWTTWNHDRTLRILRHIRSTISERIESMEERAEEVKD